MDEANTLLHDNGSIIDPSPENTKELPSSEEGIRSTISAVTSYQLCEILGSVSSFIIFDIRPVDEVLDKHICLLPRRCLVNGAASLCNHPYGRVLVQIEPDYLGAENSNELEVGDGIFLLTEEKDKLPDLLERWNKFDYILFVGSGTNPRSEFNKVQIMYALLNSVHYRSTPNTCIRYLEGGFDAFYLFISETELNTGSYIEFGNPRSFSDIIRSIAYTSYIQNKATSPYCTPFNQHLIPSITAINNPFSTRSASEPKLFNSHTNGMQNIRPRFYKPLYSQNNLGTSSIPGVSGIKSIGDTCYAGCIIQCLNGTKPVSDFFRFCYFQNRPNVRPDSNTLKTPYLSDFFAEIICKIWSNDPEPVDLTNFFRALGVHNSLYRPTVQQDAQEFLIFLLNVLDEELKVLLPLKPSNGPGRQGSLSIISYFSGRLRSEVTCFLCNDVSVNENSFLTLSLPLPIIGKMSLMKSEIKLSRCLNLFFGKEIFKKKRDARRCQRCNKVGTYTKKLSLVSLPKHIILHLKRFHVHNGVTTKITIKVDIPEKLNLSDYVHKSSLSPSYHNTHYQLYTVSNHFGQISHGHYTAQVKVGSMNKWYKFDDSIISTTDFKHINQQSAYILMYQLTDGYGS